MNSLKNILFLVIIQSLLFPGGLSGQNYTVSGYITGKETGYPLAGVNIYEKVLMIGTVTDRSGYYSLSLPSGNHTIVFSFVGYEKLELSIYLNQDSTLDAELKEETRELEEVTVHGGRPGRNDDLTLPGTVSVDIETMVNTPAFLGEVDVLRIIHLLPGVQSAGDGNTGFFVRGGNADQNLVLFDDAVVFNPSHLFSFFSVFNPDAVRGLTLYKGGIPPSYGGRLSSVLDVTMRDGGRDKLSLNGGIGLISSRISVDGPLQNDRSSFMLAARRTYADMFLKLSPDVNQRKSKLYFYDLNAKANYEIGKKDQLLISGYYGNDVTAFRDVFAFDWGNAIGSIRWNHIFSEKYDGNLSLSYSHYGFNLNGNADPLNFRWESSLSNLSLKTGFTFKPDSRSSYSLGIGSIFHNLDPGTFNSGFTNGLPALRNELSPSIALESALYFHNKHFINDGQLTLDYGLRISAFRLTGPGKQYTYDTSEPEQWVVTDTMNLRAGRRYNNLRGFEPRVSLRFTTGENSSLKAGYDRMTQYIHQVQSSQSLAPYDAWYMSSNNIPPQSAHQIVLGYFRDDYSGNLETSVEIYYKDLKNISDVIDNGNILANEFLESQLRVGKGWAYGAELLIRGTSDRADGFIGYTWSKSMRKIEGINQGHTYHSPNDRRHDFSLSGTYKINHRFSTSMNFVYSSGRAFTFPVGRMRYQGDYVPIYADRNSGRLPDYHRLDLSFNYVPGRGSNRRFQSIWNFSLFNAYARVNPITVSFKRNGEFSRSGTSFFYIPGPIPAVTWNFSF